MIDPAVSRIAERNMAQAARVGTAPNHTRRPASTCCGGDILGAAASLWCANCGATIRAADLSRETGANGGAR